MKIVEVFNKSPKRRIEPIVKVTLHDSRIIQTEFEEYVVTDAIRKDFSDLIERFVESRSGSPTSVCTWISGFFGSGKSHFLKLLGYVLEDKEIEFEDGPKKGAAEYFCEKHSLPFAKILEKELQTKAFFVNMLDFDRGKVPDITRRIFEEFLKERGYSEVFWVAEIEKMMQKRNIWNDFLAFVEDKEGENWIKLRRTQTMARTLLAQGLKELDPSNFPDLDIANKCIDDTKEEILIMPSKLAERLLEEAESIDKETGRIVILLDEVGLYIGTNTDRLTDLNVISEEISKLCKGKVWLYVTAQEALEEIIPKVEKKEGQFQWIKDRFQKKVSLTPENIDVVVKKRVLEKKSDPAVVDEITDLFRENKDSLALACLIKEPARDPHGLFTHLEEEQFLGSYPLLPYHVRLMQEIFGLLRSRGKASEDLTGRERAVLAVTRALLISEFNGLPLVEKELGILATFDMVYDAINEELKVVRSELQAIIDNDISQLGESDGITIAAVAKALFLVQQVGDWLPTTLKNISALTYPSLGFDLDRHTKRVDNCLKKLIEGKWITREDEKYRFLTEVERNFEREVSIQNASEQEKRDSIALHLKELWKKYKIYNHEGKTFDAKVIADDLEISSKGHLEIKIFSPYRVSANGDIHDAVMALSIANKGTIFWLAADNPKFEERIERAKCLDKALDLWETKTRSDEELRALEKPKRDLDLLNDDEIPRLLLNSFLEGTIYVKGDRIALDGKKKIQELFNTNMKELMEELFTEYKYAAFRLEKDEHIGSILSWQGGALPTIYSDLKLVDSKGQILVNTPVSSRVLAEIKSRVANGKDLTGVSLSEHFESPPYGWDPRILRLVLATLFKNGTIIVEIEGMEFVSSSEQGSHAAFSNVRKFNKAKFSLGVAVMPEQRDFASQKISEIFGENAGNTVEEIDETLLRICAEKLESCEKSYTIASTLGLAIKDSLNRLRVNLLKIKDAPSRSRRVITFIDESVQKAIKIDYPVLKNAIKFDLEDKVENYKEIDNFVTNLGPDLTRLNIADEEGRETLRNDLHSPSFMERWPDIIVKYQKFRDAYYESYVNKHAERKKKVKATIDSLQSHPNYVMVNPEDQKNLLSPLRSIYCVEEDISPAKQYPFVCDHCSTQISRLQLDIEDIEKRRREIKRKLDALSGPKEIKSFSEDISVENEAQIYDLLDRVKDTVSRARTADKKVRVRVDVEVK